MANGNDQQTGVISARQQPPAGQDPIKAMMEIANDPNLTPEDKSALIEFAKNRFRHRRRMAYIALYTLILSLAALFIMGFVCHTCLDKIKDATLVVSIEAFLTAIVGAYYGVSAWRPAS